MYYQRFKTEQQRFEEKYFVARNGCWLWLTGKDSRYPEFRVNGRLIRANRYVWQQHNGRELLPGEQVLHTCDNPRCVNPDHLFLGDTVANMRDRANKGRGNHPRGERNGRARITWLIAREIRRLYAAGGISQQKLADKFGMGQPTVSQIIRNEIWRDAE